MKKLIVSHPTGNANVRAALKGFLDAGMLEAFYTTVGVIENSLLWRLGQMPGMSELNRRAYSSGLKSLTHQMPFFEVSRLIAAKLGYRNLTRHEKGVFSIDEVIRRLDRKVANRIKSRQCDFHAVYGYEDGVLQTFHAADKIGATKLYDLPIGYWRVAHELFAKEREIRPQWAATIPAFSDSKDKLDRKDQELFMADHVFVASSFTCKTLENFPGPKPGISIIPYGFPTANFHPRSYYSRGPIKLLFVGGLSQRKGIANVLEAVDAFQDYVELTIVGRKPSNDCKPLNEALKKHRYYSSLPNDGILQLMREHDVLVFPSLFEGFGLVISEAMSQGTPVITTDRTAGGDLIKHGENGWLVEAGSTEALVEVIEQLITQPGEISRCGAEALKTASMRPWSVYSAELAAKVAKVTPSNN